MRVLAKYGLTATATRNGASTTATGHATMPNATSRPPGINTATIIGEIACAKKYSTVSTSPATTLTKSPDRRRTMYAGASGSSLLYRSIRILANSRNAMSCACHDSR